MWKGRESLGKGLSGLDNDAKNSVSPMSVFRFLLLEQMSVQEGCATAEVWWVTVTVAVTSPMVPYWGLELFTSSPAAAGAEWQLSALLSTSKLNVQLAVRKASGLVHLQRAKDTGATGPGASLVFAQLSGERLMRGDGLALFLRW